MGKLWIYCLIMVISINEIVNLSKITTFVRYMNKWLHGYRWRNIRKEIGCYREMGQAIKIIDFTRWRKTSRNIVMIRVKHNNNNPMMNNHHHLPCNSNTSQWTFTIPRKRATKWGSEWMLRWRRCMPRRRDLS